MDTKTNTENQKRFVDAKKEQGLKRVILWARPEDVDALKMIARQPHSIAKLRDKVERDLIKTMQPKIREKVAEQLTKKTRRAMGRLGISACTTFSQHVQAIRRTFIE